MFTFSGKTTPYGKIFKIVPKVFIATPIDVLCSNFVKFGRREIWQVAWCVTQIIVLLCKTVCTILTSLLVFLSFFVTIIKLGWLVKR